MVFVECGINILNTRKSFSLRYSNTDKWVEKRGAAEYF